jgi:DNA repair protein RadA/Sms
MSGPQQPLPRCVDCGEPRTSPHLFQCRKCKGWNFARKKDDENEVVRLSDATVSEVKRIPTMNPAMDAFFGGGIAESSVLLLGGEPGAGKTTLMLQLSECVIQRALKENRHADIVYVANEQSAAEIRDTAIRIGVERLYHICIVKAMGGLKSSLYGLIQKYKPQLMIVDSLTKLVGEDMNHAVYVAEALKTISVDIRSPTVLVNQVTKSIVHAGLEKLQHAVDMTALMHSDGVDRYIVSEKNRFGQAPMMLKMAMTAKGLVAMRMNDREEEEEEEVE